MEGLGVVVQEPELLPEAMENIAHWTASCTATKPLAMYW